MHVYAYFKKKTMQVSEVDINDEFITYAEVQINAPAAEVWDALVNPEKIKQYMFGTDVVTSWKENHIRIMDLYLK